MKPALFLTAFLALAYCVFSLFARFVTGWKTLARRFPVAEVHKLGIKYSARDGDFVAPYFTSPSLLPSLFTIELAREGVLVTCYFMWCRPILIPWNDIQKVDDNALGLSEVRICVDYGKGRSARFWLPEEALAAIQENVPTERLRKESSSQLIKDRLNEAAETAPKDWKPPLWLKMIAGSALKNLPGKEFEKENPKHDDA